MNFEFLGLYRLHCFYVVWFIYLILYSIYGSLNLIDLSISRVVLAVFATSLAQIPGRDNCDQRRFNYCNSKLGKYWSIDTSIIWKDIHNFREAILELMRQPYILNNYINICKNVVANFLRAHGEYGIKKNGGRPIKLGKREKRRMMVMASNSTANFNKIRIIYRPTVSKTTVWKILKANPFIRWERMRKYPTLTADRKKARMDFAHTHISWTSEWTETDLLPTGDLRKERRLFSTRNFEDGSLMVWAAFSSFGALELVLVSTKQITFPQKNVIFQQDNVAIHVSCCTKDWFQRRNIVFMDWPFRSPDLNPMENLWRILARQVYAHNRQLSSIEDLKKIVSEERSKIDPVILKNLSTSMTECIFQVIRGRVVVPILEVICYLLQIFVFGFSNFYTCLDQSSIRQCLSIIGLVGSGKSLEDAYSYEGFLADWRFKCGAGFFAVYKNETLSSCTQSTYVNNNTDIHSSFVIYSKNIMVDPSNACKYSQNLMTSIGSIFQNGPCGVSNSVSIYDYFKIT
uniref:DDE_3 domain-containing protein n=1 Tax=Heterorhabditis bacteriophora TaxID=37862 RepID=A0A1I7WCU9_HETBA